MASKQMKSFRLDEGHVYDLAGYSAILGMSQADVLQLALDVLQDSGYLFALADKIKVCERKGEAAPNSKQFRHDALNGTRELIRSNVGLGIAPVI